MTQCKASDIRVVRLDEADNVGLQFGDGAVHDSARELIKFSHEVKLIALSYKRPFVKRLKIDAVDAEAIVIAAYRSKICFVKPKSEE